MSLKNKVVRNTLICYLIIAVVFVAIRTLSAFGLLNFLGAWADYVFNIVVQIGLLLCVSIFLFSKLSKKKPGSVCHFFGMRKISGKAIWMSIGIGAMVFLLNIFVASFFNVILQLFGYNFSSSSQGGSYPFYMLIVNVIFTAILPGLCEEVAHRGLVLHGLSPLGWKKAVIISGLLFGLMHMNIEQFFYATIIGLFVGWLSVGCGSIFPAIIVHFMNNFLNVYISFSQSNGLVIGRLYSAFITALTSNFYLGIIFMIILCALLVWGIFTLSIKLQKERASGTINELKNVLVKQIIKQDYMHEIEKSQAEILGKEIAEALPLEENLDLEKTGSEVGLSSEIEDEMMREEGFKMDTVNKILLGTIFALLVGITLFTFIWGVL